MSSERRAFLKTAGALGLALATPLACRRAPRREDVLRALVHEVVTPDLDALVVSSAGLAEATTRLSERASEVALGRAQEAWRAALTDWKHAYCFRSGPIVETNALLRATFWPSRPSAIEAAVQRPKPQGPGALDELGVDTKGLYALEYLLFPTDDTRASGGFVGDAGARRARFADLLARDVESYARRTRERLGNGNDYAERLARAGQQSVSRLVGQMVSTVEGIAANRLALVLGLEQSHLLKADAIEGWPSGTSQRGILAQLTATARIYRGGGSGGLTDLVRSAAPAIDERVERALRLSLERVQRLGAPLERVLTTDRPALAAAAAATKALELVLKVDVSSALGVTLTFQSGDGD